MPHVIKENPLSSLIEEREQELRDLAVIQEIAGRNPGLLVLAADSIREANQNHVTQSAEKPLASDFVIHRKSNRGTTSVILDFLSREDQCSTTHIINEVEGEVPGVPRRDIAATLGMLARRGKILKTKKNRKNYYSLPDKQKSQPKD